MFPSRYLAAPLAFDPQMNVNEDREDEEAVSFSSSAAASADTNTNPVSLYQYGDQKGKCHSFQSFLILMQSAGPRRGERRNADESGLAAAVIDKWKDWNHLSFWERQRVSWRIISIIVRWWKAGVIQPVWKASLNATFQGPLSSRFEEIPPIHSVKKIHAVTETGFYALQSGWDDDDDDDD